MKSEYLDKWKNLDGVLKNHLFEIKHTLNSWEHYYYSDTFEGSIEYNIAEDELTMYDKEGNTLVEISGDDLNGHALSKYLIEYEKR